MYLKENNFKIFCITFQQSYKPLLSGHDRRARDQQEEPNVVHEAWEPDACSSLLTGYRMQYC